ncbi:methyl-accepting chemotaxis protein [Desulfovibrio inopinatus]|uniref:methyl-accepting chemotaxis protein n=1 Tax=Desulfovibrio inopinatus TaxID=102109 RepID=UPI000554F76B|nr:methyl-accepting chemotaxis protein [Desulfovibrio inopinatus]
MKNSIKTKLMVGLLSTVFIILIAIFSLVAMNFSNQALTTAKISTDHEISLANNAITLFIEESIMSVNMLANHPFSQNIDAIQTSFVNTKDALPSKLVENDDAGQQMLHLFTAMRQSHPHFVSVYCGSRKGTFVTARQEGTIPAGYDPRKRPWYTDALASPHSASLSRAYMSTTREAVMSIMRPVMRNGETIGVIAVDMSLKNLTDLTESITLGQTGYVVVVQDDGIILADPHNPKNNFQSINDVESKTFKELFALDSGSMDFQDKEGNQWIGVVLTSPKTHWKIFGIINHAEIMAPVHKTIINLTIITIVGLLLIGAAIWIFTTKTILVPLGSVRNFLDRITNGDYTYRETHNRNDEIGEILNSLNDMAEVLSNNIAEIEQKSREAEHKAETAERASHQAEEARLHAEKAKNDVLQAAATLEEVVGIVNASSRGLSDQIEESSQGAQTQANLVSETATSMDGMTTTILEVARNAAHAAETAESARNKAQEGASKVGEVLVEMDQVKTASSHLKDDMNRLGHQAENIGQVLTVISDIADQTNLLALNAAIEAARAGEAGKGFAVVADEVRKLAEKTMVATKEVGDAILAIQESAKTNMENMEHSVELIGNTAELASFSGQSLDEIMELVDTVSDQVRAIATASEEQSSASESINLSISEVNEISSRVSYAMGDATNAVSELTAQANELQDLIDNLRDGTKHGARSSKALSGKKQMRLSQ